MNDTQIVDEILRLLHKENAGHFDRVNLLDTLDSISFEIKDPFEVEEDDNEEIKRIKRIVESAIRELEDV